MGEIPKRVSERLADGLKKFKPIITEQKSRDVGEADTVTLVTAILVEVFGYDKFKDLTSEFPVKHTFCDIATKIDDKVQTLIEVKAIGQELKDRHVEQAVNYAANQGVDWVLLTNGQHWRAYFVKIKKPIEQELVIDIDFLALNTRTDEYLELLYLLCKEGWAKSVIAEYQTEREVLSRFFVGATILSDAVVAVIGRELRRLSSESSHRLDPDDIRKVLENEVIKREVLEGDKADEARRRVARAADKALRDS